MSQVDVKQYILWAFYVISECGLDFFPDDGVMEVFFQGH